VLLIFSFLSLFTLKDWLLAFHPDKCKDLSVTQKKQPLKHNYILHDHQLETGISAKIHWHYITIKFKMG